MREQRKYDHKIIVLLNKLCDKLQELNDFVNKRTFTWPSECLIYAAAQSMLKPQAGVDVFNVRESIFDDPYFIYMGKEMEEALCIKSYENVEWVTGFKLPRK